MTGVPVAVSRRPRIQTTASRVSTSARAIMTSAAVQAAGAGDAVRDAEGGDGRAGAVGRGEVEDHPGPDAGDPHARRQGTRAAQRQAVGAQPQPGGQAADRAHNRAGRHAQQVQRDVATAAGHRVQEHDGSGGHGQNRDGQGPQVELVLADLADDEEDEQRVDQVNIHAASVPRRPAPRRQPRVGLRVDTPGSTQGLIRLPGHRTPALTTQGETAASRPGSRSMLLCISRGSCDIS